MRNRNDKIGKFKHTIHELIRNEPGLCRTIKVAQGAFVYSSGNSAAMVYSIESGQIKLALFTPEGREYVLAIRTARDIFGEHCFSGELLRGEAAVAMQDTYLHAIYYSDLLKLLKGESLLEDLVQYLACCNASQQEMIGSLLAENSQQRLAKVLLQLGTPPGGDASSGIANISRILQEDLAAMVGTTRSRVGAFLKDFRERGFIELNADHSLIINTEMLEEFARQNAFKKIQKQPRTKAGSRDHYGFLAN